MSDGLQNTTGSHPSIRHQLSLISPRGSQSHPRLDSCRHRFHPSHLLCRFRDRCQHAGMFPPPPNPQRLHAAVQPTFNPDLTLNPLHHDVVLLERWSIELSRFQRGDVVTLWLVNLDRTKRQLIEMEIRSPQDPELLTTKRLVALEGDLVRVFTPRGRFKI